MHEEEIKMKMGKLPENLKKEILDYVDFLLSKYQGREAPRRKFKFDWAGELSDTKERFTSVELQHKALWWR